MRRVPLHLICAFVIAAGVTGCSAYKATRMDDEGGHQPDGSYVLTQSEKAQNCRGLQSWIRGYADSVRKLAMQQAAVQSRAPRSLFSGLTRLSGQREATSTAAAMCRQYATMLAMNRELQDRRCETVDLDAVLAAPQGLQVAAADNSKSNKVWGTERVPTLAEYRSASAPVICGAP